MLLSHLSWQACEETIAGIQCLPSKEINFYLLYFQQRKQFPKDLLHPSFLSRKQRKKQYGANIFLNSSC